MVHEKKFDRYDRNWNLEYLFSGISSNSRVCRSDTFRGTKRSTYALQRDHPSTWELKDKKVRKSMGKRFERFPSLE